MTEENKQYLTQKGYDDLRSEYNDLKENKIPEIAKKIDEAKQQGDLSENAEYHQAREEMLWAQGRLRELTVILENAEIVDEEEKTTNDTVKVGSRVKFKDSSGNGREYFIVGPQESDPLNGKISNESPIGKSFIGAKVGDTVKAETPAGINKYKILEIY